MVLKTAGRCHVQMVALDHADLDLPTPQCLRPVGDNGQHHWISAGGAHVDVNLGTSMRIRLSPNHNNNVSQLTVLSIILTANDRQPLADGGSHHERVGRAEAILVGLRKVELFKVEPKLADAGHLLHRHLASVGVVLVGGILFVDKEGFVLRRLTAAGELERATPTEAIGAGADRCASAIETFVLRSKHPK